MLSRLTWVVSRGRPVHARHLLVACGLVLGMVLATTVVLLLVHLRAAVIADSERELKNLALVLSEEADRSLQAAEAIQTSIVDHVRLHRIETPDEFEVLTDGFAFHQYLQERLAGLPMIDAIALIDTRGRLVNSSRLWPAPTVDLGDRDYIAALLAGNSVPTFIGAPVENRLNGSWSIVLARNITSSSGHVLGIVGCNIALSYFEGIFSRIALNDGSSFALYRRDGMLLARYPHVNPNIGRKFGPDEGFNALLDALDHGTVRRRSMVDGAYRLIVPHSVAHYPLLVAVTSTFQSVLKQWHDELRIYAIGTILVELVIAGIVVLGVRHLRSRERLQAAEAERVRAESELIVAREREQSARALRIQWQHFDMALGNMQQGLCRFDSEGRILVANRRFAELFQLPPDAVTPGTDYQHVTASIAATGLVAPNDMREISEQRRAMIHRHAAAELDWRLTDGRTITITHQPMDDGWLSTYDDVTARCQAEARIVHVAHHDSLTGLPNRLMFQQRLEDAMSFARRGRGLALLCLDLDQFKEVNDTLGHPIGDALLRAVAGRLDHETRQTDTVARLGGDEFAIIQNAVEQPAETVAFASRIIELLQRPFELDGHNVIIGASIGVAFAPQDALEADRLLRCADLALYRAKAEGRGVCRLFRREMDAHMQARRQRELELRHALQAGELQLFYQPLIDLNRKTPTGFEALLRWRHPTRGLVPPDDFIPLAEDIGVIGVLGEWVLRNACSEAATWPDGLKVAVNLSPAQFRSRNLITTVTDALRCSALQPDRLELEITETALLQDTELNLATLHELRDLGVRIAMDDFGTGYSSLGYLRSFPFDRVKIDKSFVHEIGTRQDCSAIVRAVVTLGAELGIATTAEGVETREQLETLADIKCTEVQGYYFSPAVPAGEVMALLPRLTAGANRAPAMAAS
jgi:diguanylate cyclase (GGDEF)-like protein